MKDTCNVINKSAGTVIYNIKEDRIRRAFSPKEIKRNMKVSELEKLVQQPGGKELLYNYLMIDDSEIVEYLLNGKVEPEYWLKESDIPNWMNTCSLDEFKDALDFAPQGTKDLIKKYAVSIPLNDYSKREAIKEQLGFDVSKALELTKEDKTDEDTNKTTRRVAPKVQEGESSPKRRVLTITE